MSYLIDTNVVSEMLKPEPNKHVVGWFRTVPQAHTYLSTLSLGEIRKGIEKLPASTKKTRLILWLEQQLPFWFEDRILPITSEVADRWGYILAKCPSSISAIDSLIAATALTYNLKVATRNYKDFIIIPGLEVINPWE